MILINDWVEVVYKWNIPSLSLLFLNGKKELELRRKLLFTIEPVREIDSSDTAVGVDSHTQSFNIITTISPPCKIRKIELNLIPALIKPHRHCADERFHSGCRLIVRCPKSSAHIFVIEYLYLESKILLELNRRWITFLIIMTRKGSLMPNVSLGFWGQVIKAVVTLVPIISSTEDWISWSVILLMWPFWTMFNNQVLYFSHIWSGLLPILYRIDRNPDWYVFLNIYETSKLLI